MMNFKPISSRFEGVLLAGASTEALTLVYYNDKGRQTIVVINEEIDALLDVIKECKA